MLLNGKCADRFKEWLKSTYKGEVLSYAVGWDNGSQDILEFIENFEHHYDGQGVLPISMLYALIIEFMDSEGILIEISLGYDLMAGYNRGFDWYVRVDKSKTYFTNEQDVFPSRTEALKAAIEKANDLINTKNQ